MPSAPSPSIAASPADCFDRAGLPRRFGRYLLLRLLARGGMGQVFLGSTCGVEGAERPVVIKVIRREHAKDPNFLARFLDEARVHAQLHHSGVAQVLEAATYAPTGDPYVVIEFVEGRSLGQVRRRLADVGGRLRWEQVVALGALLLEGLTYVHERCDAMGTPLDIVHRDLSPHNVMVGFGGEVKVIDFGTARGTNRKCHTVAGVVFAKPGYVAPEVAQGASGDARVDLYAVGVMMWELLAGRRFLQGDAAAHLAAVGEGRRDLPPIASRVGAPPALDEVLAALTHFERDQRYRTTRAATTSVARLLADAPALSNGERGTRARVAQLMYTLYPAQPGRSRRDFSRLVATARAEAVETGPPPLPADASYRAEDEEEAEGVLPGTRYRLRRELGRGASSVVYEAEHLDLGRRVALKVLAPEHTHSAAFAARFRREARTLSRLQDPALARVFDFGQARDGRLFCAMERLEGHLLRDELEQEEFLPWPRVLELARQALGAMAVAHQHGIIHRDVKPENLFLGADGRVRLLDFGLAKSPGEVDATEELPDGALTLFGTPEYMAPEQVEGGEVDPRADLYALGCVMYEALTGRLPFVGRSAVEVLDRKLEGCPESVRERAPKLRVPRAVSHLVGRAMARHPRRRFADAQEMRDAIDEALAAPARVRRRRRAAGGALLAGVMTMGTALVIHESRPWLTAHGYPGWTPTVTITAPDDDGRSGPSPPTQNPNMPDPHPHRGSVHDHDTGPRPPSPPSTPGPEARPTRTEVPASRVHSWRQGP
ncbi:MAG: serine/threonine-protein kinase [Myxococcota bacterium]